MRLVTARVQHWRDFKSDDYLFVDITRKSGDPVFAPSRDLLNDYKYKGLSVADYTAQYTQEMRDSYKKNPERWRELVLSDKIVVIACYCPPNKFCHRYLLLEFLKALAFKMNQPFDYIGENPKRPFILGKPNNGNTTNNTSTGTECAEK